MLHLNKKRIVETGKLKNLLVIRSKKGVSEMIGYVVLIVIALTLSIIVYVYLDLQIPKGGVSCQEGISIGLEEFKCYNDGTEDTLNVTLANNGRFKINAAYVRFGKEEKSIRKKLGNLDTDFYLGGPNGLQPGESFKKGYFLKPSNIDVKVDDKYIIEVEPAILDRSTIVACSKNVILQEVTCETHPPSTS